MVRKDQRNGGNSDMKLHEIYRSSNYYSVCKCDRVKDLVIDVTCGGIAMHNRIVELNPDEIAEFHRTGNLDDLAYKIGKGDQEILKRELLPESDKERMEYVEKL